MTPLHPDRLTPSERLTELGQILAASLMRLQARNPSPVSDDRRDSCVDFLPDQSGHAAALQPALPGSRLAYRIQELAYGGLKPETVRRLEQLGEQLDGGNIAVRRVRGSDIPIAGTRLLREYQGVEYTVTVTTDGYEWQGRPYKSLSVIARAITGTRWNGLLFFGLKNRRSAA